jgi:hypothetical protein
MLLLAMEIPDSFTELQTLCDYQFTLAQDVLERPWTKYHEFVILDNGFHELGHPLGTADLLRAVNAIQPDVVAAPDKLGDQDFTWRSWLEMTSHLPPSRVALTLTTENQEDRHNAAHGALMRGCRSLALPYRMPRSEWWADLERMFTTVRLWPTHIHLFGMSDWADLRFWARTSRTHPRITFTIDTSKPIKWAINGQMFTHEMKVRHSGVDSKTLTQLKELTPLTQSLAYYNTAFLRKYLA